MLQSTAFASYAVSFTLQAYGCMHLSHSTCFEKLLASVGKSKIVAQRHKGRPNTAFALEWSKAKSLCTLHLLA